ncbi:MAG: hypothetical protein JJV98_17750 [Desulfosarcina sp.]|nr:hypothetical protein [Desulfobacterales bacterium]
MNLQARLDAHKKDFEAKAPPEALAIMHRATEELENSGILTPTVKIGALAPDFRLANTEGTEIALGDLLDKGFLILAFYRGRW